MAYPDNEGKHCSAGPRSNCVTVIPSDGADLPVNGYMYFETSGPVQFTTVGGQTHTMSFSAGTVFPIMVKKIFATDTTATIKLLY